jgi:hypothetical protein
MITAPNETPHARSGPRGVLAITQARVREGSARVFSPSSFTLSSRSRNAMTRRRHAARPSAIGLSRFAITDRATVRPMREAISENRSKIPSSTNTQVDSMSATSIRTAPSSTCGARGPPGAGRKILRGRTTRTMTHQTATRKVENRRLSE